MKKEFRCSNIINEDLNKKCNTKLGEYDIQEGKVEIICPKCGAKNKLEVKKKSVDNIKVL